MILIYVTYKNITEAKKVTTALLKKKLIACAVYFPVKSSYLWKEKIENANEVVTLLKTRKTNWKKVKKAVKELHSYETPCIIKIAAEGHDKYVDWLYKETN